MLSQWIWTASHTYWNLWSKQLNWRKVIWDGSIQEFQEYVSSNLSPLLNHSLETIAEIDKKIVSVTSILHHAATETISVIRNSTKVKTYICNDELKKKCQRSKVAWHHWWNAGQSRSGHLYKKMKAAKYESSCMSVSAELGRNRKWFKPGTKHLKTRMTVPSKYIKVFTATSFLLMENPSLRKMIS